MAPSGGGRFEFTSRPTWRHKNVDLIDLTQGRGYRGQMLDIPSSENLQF